jgi:phage gpG-like protein
MADLEVRAESDLDKVLAGLAAQGRSIDRLLPVIAEMLVGAVHDVFEAEGPGWADLAESTKARRRGTSYKILQDTGLLANSVAAQYGSTYAEAVDGTTYGIYHAPDPQGRDWTVLGPFEAPLLDDVAALITGQF